MMNILPSIKIMHTFFAMRKMGVTIDELTTTWKKCVALGYLRLMSPSSNHTFLTEKGQERALYGHRQRQTTAGGINIGNATFHGPAQVGNYNHQEFKNCFENMIQQIDMADASDEEKRETKGLFGKCLEHPLVSAILGSAVGAWIVTL